MAGPFAPLLEADALDERILRAIAETMGERDIVVRETYRGLDRATGAPVDAEPNDLTESLHRPRILVEWIRRKGRFGLDVEMWGAGVRDDVTEAELARRFVRALGAPILVSDCSHFGFSWLKHDIDGSIWEVVTNTQDINDFDLLCDRAPDDPDFHPARLVWAADRALPPLAARSEARARACEGEAPGSTRLCRPFGAPFCPKWTSR